MEIAGSETLEKGCISNWRDFSVLVGQVSITPRRRSGSRIEDCSQFGSFVVLLLLELGNGSLESFSEERYCRFRRVVKTMMRATAATASLFLDGHDPVSIISG